MRIKATMSAIAEKYSGEIENIEDFVDSSLTDGENVSLLEKQFNLQREKFQERFNQYSKEGSHLYLLIWYGLRMPSWR